MSRSGLSRSAGGAARPAAWKTMAALAAVGLALGLAGAGLVGATGSAYEAPALDLSMVDAEATYAACQGFVRRQLKAPGPVTFAPLRWRTVRRFADGRRLVRSHLDATNTAGRQVEVRLTCTLRPLGGDRWDLENLTLRSD